MFSTKEPLHAVKLHHNSVIQTRAESDKRCKISQAGALGKQESFLRFAVSRRLGSTRVCADSARPEPPDFFKRCAGRPVHACDCSVMARMLLSRCAPTTCNGLGLHPQQLRLPRPCFSPRRVSSSSLCGQPARSRSLDPLPRTSGNYSQRESMRLRAPTVLPIYAAPGALPWLG